MQPEVDLGVEKQFPILNYGWIERKKNESVIETQCPDVDLYKWVETNISNKTSPQLKSYV